MSNAALTETLEHLAAELSTEDVWLKQIQGTVYVRTRYTKPSEWAQNVGKVRTVAKTVQERLGRESLRTKPDVGGFWNMGRFCKEEVVMSVKVKLTEEEHTQVLLGCNP